METATELATKAADQLFQYQVLGIVVVGLVLMLLGSWSVIFFMWRENKVRVKELVDLHVAWRLDTASSRDSITGALKTVDNALAVAVKGRR